MKSSVENDKVEISLAFVIIGPWGEKSHFWVTFLAKIHSWEKIIVSIFSIYR